MTISKDVRRNPRIPYQGPIRIAWEEHGQPRFATTKCLDISAEGLRIESSQPVPRGAVIQLNAERIGLAGSATVKHVVRKGAKYLLGLELSQAVLSKTIAVIESLLPQRAP
jgi:hypothetical protein